MERHIVIVIPTVEELHLVTFTRCLSCINLRCKERRTFTVNSITVSIDRSPATERILFVHPTGVNSQVNHVAVEYFILSLRTFEQCLQVLTTIYIILDSLDVNTYTVQIFNTATGCTNTEIFSVTDSIVKAAFSTETLTPNSVCDNFYANEDGAIQIDDIVPDPVNDPATTISLSGGAGIGTYKVVWYAGELATGVALDTTDFSLPEMIGVDPGLAAGKYTGVILNVNTLCLSNKRTFEILTSFDNPDTEIQITDQTACPPSTFNGELLAFDDDNLNSAFDGGRLGDSRERCSHEEMLGVVPGQNQLRGSNGVVVPCIGTEVDERDGVFRGWSDVFHGRVEHSRLRPVNDPAARGRVRPPAHRDARGRTELEIRVTDQGSESSAGRRHRHGSEYRQRYRAEKDPR